MDDALTQESLPPLEVGTNPQETERVTRPGYVLAVVATVLSALLAVAVGVLSGAISGVTLGFASALPFMFTFAASLFLAVSVARTRGIQSVKRTALTLDAAGLQSNAAAGELSLPWSAIEQVTLRSRGKHRILTFHVAPGLTPGSNGVSTTWPVKSFAALRKHGFQVGQAAIDTPLETLVAAAAAFTGGRLAPPAG